MNKHRAMKAITNRGRCGHPFCSDCRKKRGRNRQNRRDRRNIKVYLKKWA